MKTARWLAIVLSLLCVLVAPAWAEAEGWGLPSWNPFAGEEKPSKASESSWKTGKKTDSVSSKSPSSSSNEPSMWSKMGSGTSSAWKKTTSTLTPWKKEKKTPARSTGSRNARKAAATPKSKTTWYNPGTWFEGDEKKTSSQPQRQAESVGDFLNQPRPK